MAKKPLKTLSGNYRLTHVEWGYIFRHRDGHKWAASSWTRPEAERLFGGAEICPRGKTAIVTLTLEVEAIK